MTENEIFILGGPEMQLHDILWAIHDGTIMVEVRARKISGSSRLRWVVRGRVMHVSLIHVRVWVRGVGALTEHERLHCKVRVTEPERSIDGC